METKSNIRNRFAQAVMTLLVTLLSTVTAWAQTPIEGLTYNETDGCYDISTLTELKAFISYANSVSDQSQCDGMTFRLIQDIGSSENPVGDITTVKKFKGNFDGNGHAITGMVVTQGLQTGNYNTSATGFFCRCYGGSVKNLTLTDVTVDAMGQENKGNVGAIYGRGWCKVENCHVTGCIKGYNFTGGLVGFYGTTTSAIDYNNFSISNSTFSGSITAIGRDVGGIVGQTGFPVRNCTVTNTTIICGGYVGGIAGASSNAETAIFTGPLITGCKVANVALTCTDTNEGYRRAIGGIVGRCGGYTSNYLAPTTYGCIYEYGDDNVKGVGGYKEGGVGNDLYGTDEGCTRVYAVHCGEGVTATYASGTKVSIGDVTCYENGATFTVGLGDAPEGYFFRGYAVTDGSGNNVTATALSGTTLTLPASDLTISALWVNDKDFSLTGDNEYTIKTATGWKMFCDMIESGESFSGKTVYLETNIGTEENPVRRMAGGKDYEFAGTFDGQGKTLYVNITGTVQGTAPFCEIKGATIRNLVVTGSVAGMKHSAGLVGFARGDDASVENTIENCLVATDVSITGDNAGYLGGIVGHGLHCKLTIRGCAFTGSLTSEENYTGGLQGWSDGNTLILTDDLFAPTSVSAANVGFHPIAFHLNNATTTATVSNVYYTVEPTCTTASLIATTSAAEQPKQAYVYTPANISFVPANVGEATGNTYDVSDITLYESGMKQNGKFYLVKGSVSLADDAVNDIALIDKLVADVTFSNRTLYKDGSWNTLCLPFDLTLSGSVLDGDNVELMTLGDASFSQGTLSLSFVDADEIKAGKPYIIRWDNTGSHIVNPVFKGVTIVNASLDENAVTINDVISFKGIYSPFEITEANNKLLYLGDGNQIYYPSAAMTINAFRAYFELQGDLECGEPSSTDNGINAFVLNFGDETTSIEHETIEHSPLTIDHEADGWYTLDGRKLSGKPTAKGIYIKDGKKFVIK